MQQGKLQNKMIEHTKNYCSRQSTSKKKLISLVSLTEEEKEDNPETLWLKFTKNTV